VVYYESTLFETTDEGKTFAALPAAFDSSLLLETVDVTATDPNRIYVSAVRDPGEQSTAVLLTSNDRGKSFVETPIASERDAFIAAVDPTNADRVYVRTSNTNDKPSRLFVSDDAGKTFRNIFTGTGPLAGFALSDDGKRIYIGGPQDGLRVANTVDYQWEQKSQVEIGCLKLANDGLWACSTEKSGFVVGLSTDEGATFQTKLHFCDIRGPLACAVGSSTHTECSLGGTSPPAPPWPSQSARLGCGGDPDGGDLDGGRDGSAEAGPELLDPGGSGCGCSVRTPPPARFAALLAGVAATVALLRRRRSRSEP
jgi:MYXO-CTERM domain-containing protein